MIFATWEGFHNHTGGKWQHLLAITSEQPRGFSTGRLRVLDSCGPRTGVGVAGIDYQCSYGGTRIGKMFPGDQDRRGAKLVLSKRPGDMRAGFERNDKQVLTSRFPDLRFGSAQGNASYRK